MAAKKASATKSTGGKITTPSSTGTAVPGKNVAPAKTTATPTVRAKASDPVHTTAPPANQSAHRPPDSEPLPQAAPLSGQIDFADLTAEVAAEINKSGRHGKWGSGRELDERLKAAGHDPKKVRAAISKLRKSKKA